MSKDRSLILTVTMYNSCLNRPCFSLVDPFVEVILFHGGRIIKYKKTSCRIKDCNPVFNESLTFHIPHGILHQSSLLIAVKNDAGITSNDVLLGQVLLGPEATGFAFEHWNEMRVNNKPVARWHKLHSA